MRDNLSLFFGLILLIAGAVLLNNGVSNAYASQMNQSATALGGATFLSFGSMVMWTVLKNWWKWKKECERYRNG